MRVTLKIGGMGEQLKHKFAQLLDKKSNMYKELAVVMIPIIHERIHVDGKAADGSQIGNYTPEYMKVRTGIYPTNEKYKKGKKKGQSKAVGVYTKGKNKGAQRPQYNRTSDTKVVLSLTRQMENDYAAILGNISWGIGFNNPINFDKAGWNEETYKKKIYALTNNELEFAEKTIANLVKEFN